MDKTKPALTADEIANTITHGFGLVLSLIGLTVLLTLAWRTGNYWHKLSCTIYGLSLVILYAASTLYHSARGPRAKKMLRVADHCGIYLLIAGSYTPFVLGPLREGPGWKVFILVWTLALLGIVLRLLVGNRYRAVSVVGYLLLGWLSVFLIKPLLALVPLAAVLWIIASGLAYSFGVIFYGTKFWRYNHAVWHVFVLIGSACHFWAVVAYVLHKG